MVAEDNRKPESLILRSVITGALLIAAAVAIAGDHTVGYTGTAADEQYIGARYEKVDSRGFVVQARTSDFEFKKKNTWSVMGGPSIPMYDWVSFSALIGLAQPYQNPSFELTFEAGLSLRVQRLRFYCGYNWSPNERRDIHGIAFGLGVS